MQNTWLEVCKALKEAREAYKKYVNKKKRAPQKDFKVVDKVYLSTKFLQSRQPCKKLGQKYIGSFPIIRVMNPVTVELKLP